MIIQVTDLKQAGPDIFANLTERELRNAYEKQGGFFIAESPKVIERALDAGYEPISMLMEEKHITGDAAFLIQRCPNLPVYTAPRSVLEQLTGYKLTRGVLCALKRKEPDSLEQAVAGAHRVAVLENIADASNVGAIFRSAAALGIDAVLITPQCADPLNRRCLRVSMGNVFMTKWARIGTEASDWPEKGMSELNRLGFKTLSMALRNNSVDINDSALLAQEKLAILLGTEGDGLLPQTIDSSDYVVKIPMRPGVDSLNVAAAAAVIFWELGKNNTI
ncbi:MAG: RNA methyltransferase [Spirochaetia bacterium]|nr:RNA methyltransferase [Spirochaetia bacterium]MDD7268680.1 RNA methyltransferase [Treponema sp.]MDY4984682.1 RNA methyltransferase [Treponema sp.]